MATKALLINQTEPVSEVIQLISEKMSARPNRIYGLKVMDTGLWLVGDLSISEQCIPEDVILAYEPRCSMFHIEVDENTHAATHSYTKLRDGITSGMIWCDSNQAVTLASLQAQIEYGDWRDGQSYEFTSFIPPRYRERITNDMVTDAYKKIIGMSFDHAKNQYQDVCKGSEYLGSIFFPVRMAAMESNTKLLLQISHNEFTIRADDSFQVIKKQPFTYLRKWAVFSNTLFLDFGKYERGPIKLESDNINAIEMAIKAEIECLVKERTEARLQQMTENCSTRLKSSWPWERFLWIGKMKEEGSYCELSKLPRDIIREIAGLLSCQCDCHFL